MSKTKSGTADTKKQKAIRVHLLRQFRLIPDSAARAKVLTAIKAAKPEQLERINNGSLVVDTDSGEWVAVASLIPKVAAGGLIFREVASTIGK